jgi:Papain family cysteine protease
MPEKAFKVRKKTVVLDARPDRPDLRDRIYMPPLRPLPPEYPPADWVQMHLPAYCEAGLILDQGSEGACTGFGLAAVINYLQFRAAVVHQAPMMPRVSERMLYHLARRYDEWPGEDYEGSSCRGAMKGWFHHGVTGEAFWPYRNRKGDVAFIRPKNGWDADAALRPLGAYYRIMADSISDMQAAINETGAIYVAGDVHKGWDMGAYDTLPDIPWQPGTKPDGGHAFAIVGYDAKGFIVQNSWGGDYGFKGFVRMLYGDWLENGDDAWVAVLGAPIAGTAPSIVLSSERTVPVSAPHLSRGLANGITAAAVAEQPRPEAWDTATAVKHALVLGNEGLPEQITIDDENGSQAAVRVCQEFPDEWLAEQKGAKRIVVYTHGGLNGIGDAIARTKVMGPWFEKNGVYPIFVCWQSGYLDSIKNIITDVVGSLVRQAEPRRRSIFEAISDARDRLLETAAIPAARPVWSEMKENASAASRGDGGMVVLAKALTKLADQYPKLEIHLVGHSAGAIVLGAFLGQLETKGLKASTTSLYAPACTVDFALRTYLKAAQNKTINPKTVTVDLLSDVNEKHDTVVEAYGKSLLYLVSRALEPSHKTPLLGMEAAWNPALDKETIFATDTIGKPHPDVVEWRTTWMKAAGGPQVLAAKEVEDQVKPRTTIESSHGCFDNWINCVERTLQRMLGLASVTQLPTRITSLKGF